jgi:hypothetical protein
VCMIWNGLTVTNFLWSCNISESSRPNVDSLVEDYKTFCMMFAQHALAPCFARVWHLLHELLLDE